MKARSPKKLEINRLPKVRTASTGYRDVNDINNG